MESEYVQPKQEWSRSQIFQTPYTFATQFAGRIVSFQPDTDIQKLLSNGKRIRIRITETLFLMFRGFRLLEKTVAHCTIIYSVSLNASLQPSVP